uniref:Pyridoxal phosphate homeostasis protein n=1 Tax=Corethrella appendiculata TaxID=1370023 RepID=U5ET25_9DIPT
MYRRIMSEVDVKLGIKSILDRIDIAYNKRAQTFVAPKPKLVAVSKTKPIELILDAYSVGQRDFGENYVKELVEKATNSQILEQCKDIRWHFIGHLQRNKINKIVNLPGLSMIQTVDSEKLADSLNTAWGKLKTGQPGKENLEILIQINTSDEDEKNGVEPNDAPNLYRHVIEKCTNLKCVGIMTIGKFGHDYSKGPNPDFITLMKCHAEICTTFELDPMNVNVSMGMSDDFENAIDMGSTIVRVGSSIFGYRPKKNES